MIILDTHIWIWWFDNNPRLTQKHREYIQIHQSSGLGISIISCWEFAKLVENNKLVLACSVAEWLNTALADSEIELLSLTVPIIIESAQLQGFHKDPADQLIVATAKIYNCPILTADTKILSYPNVQKLT